MNTISALLAAAVAMSFSLPAPARAEAGHERFGQEKPVNKFNLIEVKNLQDQTLGRITDLGIDLVNGRIVEVLVETDSSLSGPDKVVAVPPLALHSDGTPDVYRLAISAATFKAAPVVDLSTWQEAGQSDRIAAAYRLFGQEPYFMAPGVRTLGPGRRPKARLGYVERLNKIMDMAVGNFQDEKFGRVSSMTLDIPGGRILTVVILAPGNFKTMSIVPAMALRFNSKRDALLLDDNKAQFADEPRLILTEEAYGQKGETREESYKGPHTSVALEQGMTRRDENRTAIINRRIRASNIDDHNVHVGTINGRVTLRGWVESDRDREFIGEIAIAASRMELVDNQITVGRPGDLN